MSLQLHLWLVGLALAVQPMFAKDELAPINQGAFQSHVWGKTDGLPDNSVTAVLQARDGFLWVGTQNGLARFDGIHFLLIPFPGAHLESLWVTDLCEDRSGRLWIGTQQNGLFRLWNGNLRHYGKAEGLSNDSIASLALDSSGSLWVGTHAGLDRWDGRRFEIFTTRDGLPDDSISSVYVARSGTIWITTRSGVSVFGKSGITPYRFDVIGQGRSPEFLGVYEDRQHNLWAYGDTYLVNLNEGKRFNYFRSGEAASVRIWTFYQGRDGRLWIGTSGRGLFQFTGERFRPVTIHTGRLPNDVRAICEDREGSLWLGTDGGGLIQLRTERLRNLGPVQGLDARPVTCLAQDAVGRVWVAFKAAGVFYGDEEHFEPYVQADTGGLPQQVRSISATKDGTVCFGTSGLGLSLLRSSRLVECTTANGLSDDHVTATAADSHGTIWAGTADGRVFKWDGNSLRAMAAVDGKVTVLAPGPTNRLWVGTQSGDLFSLADDSLMRSSASRALKGHSISALSCDAAGRLWIGTLGGGLACLRGNTIRVWTIQDGLPDLNVYSVQADSSGNLWLTTGKGIYHVEAADLNGALRAGNFQWMRLIETFPAGEMIPVGSPSTMESSDRMLWFATGHGVVSFDPRGWLPDPIAPPVYLESVKVNGRPIKLLNLDELGDFETNNVALKVSSGIHGLDFNFTAPCFAAPDKVRFLYKLEGLDSDWNEADALTRRVHYASLAYGQYQFRVIACNPDGIWNRAGASFAFIISPPWWRSSFALAGYALTAALLVAISVRIVSHRRLRRRLQALESSQAMARERMRIAQDMHDEIGSKLARISYLSEDLKSEIKEPEPPRAKVESIANTSRDLLQSLDQMVWAVNPRNDTLEHLVAYLGQCAAEYFQNTSIQCEVHLPPYFPEEPLSADIRHNVLLGFKEALSNAMKHSGASCVSVDIQVDSEFLAITISDNGSGFETDRPATAAPSPGRPARHGLSGLRHRLESIGGSCEFKSASGRGTVVLFRIPLSHSHKPIA